MKWAEFALLLLKLSLIWFESRKDPNAMYERAIAELAEGWANEKADELTDAVMRHDMRFVARILTDLKRKRVLFDAEKRG